MNRGRPRRLAGQLMTAHALVVAIGALTLAGTATAVAPVIFRQHLARAGLTSAPARQHAEEALVSSLAVSLTLATVTALVAGGIASWVLVRGVSVPVAQLARAADDVAAGDFAVELPSAPPSIELQRLSQAFSHMASRLADTDAARSRLLSDLAHELRTPLATLSAYVDGLQDGVLPLEPASFDTMRAQVSRLTRLSSDVRDAAAAQEGVLGLRVQDTDPVAVAQQAVEAAAPRFAARGVGLDYLGPSSADPVPADPQRLAQVLANLLDNALRHTPARGHVVVSVHVQDTEVQLAVTDDGPGIPADQLEAVFSRFHRVDPSRAASDGSGSGLGLTIARAIAASHGGTLVATRPGTGRGTTMTLTLPRRRIALVTP